MSNDLAEEALNPMSESGIILVHSTLMKYLKGLDLIDSISPCGQTIEIFQGRPIMIDDRDGIRGSEALLGNRRLEKHECQAE